MYEMANDRYAPIDYRTADYAAVKKHYQSAGCGYGCRPCRNCRG